MKLKICYFGVSFWKSFVALTPKDTEGLILDIWPTKSSPRNVVATFGFKNWQDCTRCNKLWCKFYLFQGSTYASSHMNLETVQRFGLVIFCFFQSFCMCFMSFFQSLCMCAQIELLLVHSDLSDMLTFCTFCKVLAIAIPTWKVASPMGQEQGVGEEYIVTYRPYCCSIPWQCKACPASSAMIPFFKDFPKGSSLGWIPFARAVKLHSSHSQRGEKVLVVEQLFGKGARSWWLCIPTFLIKGAQLQTIMESLFWYSTPSPWRMMGMVLPFQSFFKAPFFKGWFSSTGSLTVSTWS